MQAGPFHLQRRMAIGGMAEVWLAHHRSTPVVVKFLSFDRSEARLMFADEVRAHAKLQHPHILQILDHGVTKEEINSDLPKNTPWLALEYASGGELTALAPSLKWPGVRIVLMSLLDALAHAHAHGVIHRDLKPANILISGPEDARPGLKLADFGIAHLKGVDTPSEFETRAPGTASAMAPEQCRGAFREFGPWTDLYALGCVAYWLTSHRWPFGTSGNASIVGHLRRAPPNLDPQFEVPPGFEAWTRKLLEKKPVDRYASAAHAIHALLQLPAPEGPAYVPAPLIESKTIVEHAYTGRWAPGPTPGFPTDWRRPASPPQPRPLADAGLRLFPLRQGEMTGRESERDALWDTLKQTRESGTAQAVLIRGAHGAGVSELGSWFAHRCATLAAAHVFATSCFPEEEADAPLKRLLADALNTHGLDGKALRRTIEVSLDIHRQRDSVLCELLGQVVKGSVRDPRVRNGAVRRLITTRSASRPAVLWIDDAHLSSSTLGLVESLLKSPAAPLMIVLGVGQAQTEQLTSLSALETCQTLQLGPLGDWELKQMIRQSLPVEAGLEAQLIDESGGLPGAVANALDRLVQTQALRGTPHGFELVRTGDTTTATFVGNLPGLGVDDVIGPLGEDAMKALVRAAVLGGEVSLSAWARVCDDPEGRADPRKIPLSNTLVRHRLLERLKELALAIVSQDGWRFANHEFRRAVVHAASVRGSWLEAERAVATYLRAENPTEYALRIARHSHRAGDTDQAFESCMRGIVEPTGENRLAACELAAQILLSANVPEDDERWGKVRGWRLSALPPDRHEEALNLANRLIESSSAGRSPELLGLALAEVARQAAPRVERARTRERATAALRVLDKQPLTPLTLQARISVATAWKFIGDNQAAIAVLANVVDAAKEASLQRIFSHAWSLLAGARMALDARDLDLDEAESRIETLVAEGDLFAATSLLVISAHVALARKEVERATKLSLRDLSLRRVIGRNASATLQNLVHAYVAKGDAELARKHLDALILEGPSGYFEAQIALARFAWAAVAGDPLSVRTELERMQAAMGTPSFRTDRVDATLVRHAAQYIAAFDPELAKQVESLAYRWVPT